LISGRQAGIMPAKETGVENVHIAPAGRADIPLLAECRYRMFADMFANDDYSGVKERFVAAVADYYAARFGKSDELSLVARMDGEPVGCGSIIFEARPPHVKSFSVLFGYILNVYVRPEFRRKGVATKIMQALHKEAKARGVKKIGLHASQAGAAVYAKLGYAVKESYMEMALPEA
jgi:GNAT superfamily N-acetyltransferase